MKPGKRRERRGPDPGNGLAARTWGDLRWQWRSALAFHVLMQLLGVAIFTPLATGIGGLLVAASGEPVVSNYDIASFVLSPPVIEKLRFVHDVCAAESEKDTAPVAAPEEIDAS